MFSNFMRWAPIQKIRAIIWTAAVSGLLAVLDQVGQIDWQTELADKVGARWAFPLALIIGAAIGYGRRSAPDERPHIPAADPVDPAEVP